MKFRNLLNFILCSITIFAFLKYVPCSYDVFALVSSAMVGLKLTEWMMTITRKHVLYKTVSPEKKAVLITGCDTGFGNALARRMDRLGYKVFAACLDPEGNDAKKLMANCSDKLTVLPMNVTDDRSIQEAKEFIATNIGQNDLWAVVNNAGITHAGETDWTTFEELQAVYDVNAAGILRVTKAFLPFIKQSEGRIVNTNSIGGRIIFPGTLGYCMSKAAAVSLTTSLRTELAKWGVEVISIEPFFYSTQLTETKRISALIDKGWEKAPQDIKEQYGEEYKEAFKKCIDKSLTMYCSPRYYEVVDCLVDAITAEEPLTIYTPSQFIYKILVNLLLHLPTGIHDCVQRFQINTGVKPAALLLRKHHND